MQSRSTAPKSYELILVDSRIIRHQYPPPLLPAPPPLVDQVSTFPQRPTAAGTVCNVLWCATCGRPQDGRSQDQVTAQCLINVQRHPEKQSKAVAAAAPAAEGAGARVGQGRGGAEGQ